MLVQSAKDALRLRKGGFLHAYGKHDYRSMEGESSGSGLVLLLL